MIHAWNVVKMYYSRSCFHCFIINIAKHALSTWHKYRVFPPVENYFSKTLIPVGVREQSQHAKKAEGGRRWRRVQAQQKHADCRAAVSNWFHNKGNALYVAHLEDKSILWSDKCWWIKTDTVNQKQRFLCPNCYSKEYWCFTLYNILLSSHCFIHCSTYQEFFLIDFIHACGINIPRSELKKIMKEEEEKGTWLLPFREQYSPKKKWRVYVSSWSAWWVAPLKPLYIIWPGQQKRLESAQVNHSDVVDGPRLYLLICSDTLKNKINRKNPNSFYS